MRTDKLHALAVAATQNSHAPYSSFQVGAAILTSTGNYYSGCNIENASYPEGWCAETTAIGQMVMAGDKEISAMAVFCQQMDKITPCGGCRQRLSEFGNSETKVHLCDKDGVVETVTLGELLPRAFEF